MSGIFRLIAIIGVEQNEPGIRMHEPPVPRKSDIMELARKAMVPVPMAGQTIIHEITGVHGASRVLLKPAAPGTGVIAGGAVRQIIEAAGIRDVLAKSQGSPTHINVAKATMEALLGQLRPDEVAKARGKRAEEIFPPALFASLTIMTVRSTRGVLTRSAKRRRTSSNAMPWSTLFIP